MTAHQPEAQLETASSTYSDVVSSSPEDLLDDECYMDTLKLCARPSRSEVPGGLGTSTVYGSDDKHMPPESPPPLPLKSARIAVKAKPYKSTPQLPITPEVSPPESTVIPPQLPPRKPKIPETPDESIIPQPRPCARPPKSTIIPPPPPLPPNSLSNNVPLPPPPSLPRPKRVARKNVATKRRSSGQVLHDDQKSQAAEQGN
jgi:hypothetical protein